jgi:hypothetical protein
MWINSLGSDRHAPEDWQTRLETGLSSLYS